MSPTVIDVMRALDFAARKHQDQRRKGASAEPYINHLVEVALLVAEATDGRDLPAVIGAILHDTLEDTDARYQDLHETFGADVAILVAEVTDDKRLPKAERKRRQIESASSKSSRAKLIKIADKISNLRSTLNSPPADWDGRRRIEYFAWAHQVVAGCRGVHAELEDQFDEVYRRGITQLGSIEPH